MGRRRRKPSPEIRWAQRASTSTSRKITSL
jgi:hypothetical protein